MMISRCINHVIAVRCLILLTKTCFWRRTKYWPGVSILYLLWNTKIFPFFTLHICFYAASLAVISLGGLCPLRFWWKGKLVLIIIIVFNTININIINVITWTLGLVDSDPKALSMMVSATLAIVDFSSAEELWNCNLTKKLFLWWWRQKNIHQSWPMAMVCSGKTIKLGLQ